MPVGVHTDQNGDYRFTVAKGAQNPNFNVRVSGCVTSAVHGAYPGNIGPDGKQRYAMVCISNGTTKTAIIENCTVNGADYAFNTEEMASTTTHFVSCTAVNSTVNAFELQSSMLQTLTNCVAISTHRNTGAAARGVFMADTPQGPIARSEAVLPLVRPSAGVCL